jgi:hypothetical protein
VNSTLPTIFAWAEEHVRLFQVVSALVAIAIGGGGFVLGWLLRHGRTLRDRQNYRSLVLDQQIAFEAHLLRETIDGIPKPGLLLMMAAFRDAMTGND